MKFEEITKIDTEPFEKLWLTEFIECLLNWHVDLRMVINIILMNHFWMKFNDRYGTNINVTDGNIFFTSSIQTMEEIYEVDGDYLDYILEYRDNNGETFWEMACFAGFEVLYLPLYQDEDFDSDIWEENKKVQKLYLKNLIYQYERSWRPILWKNADMIKKTSMYLEEPVIFILRNKDIGLYRRLCHKYERQINDYLPAEKKLIDDMISNLKYPLYFYNENEEGFLDDYYYIYFDMGSNGHQYLDFFSLNPNWIVTCFAFGKAMADFKEKMHQLLEINPELRKVS